MCFRPFSDTFCYFWYVNVKGQVVWWWLVWEMTGTVCSKKPGWLTVLTLLWSPGVTLHPPPAGQEWLTAIMPSITTNNYTSQVYKLVHFEFWKAVSQQGQTNKEITRTDPIIRSGVTTLYVIYYGLLYMMQYLSLNLWFYKLNVLVCKYLLSKMYSIQYLYIHFFIMIYIYFYIVLKYSIVFFKVVVKCREKHISAVEILEYSEWP